MPPHPHRNERSCHEHYSLGSQCSSLRETAKPSPGWSTDVSSVHWKYPAFLCVCLPSSSPLLHTQSCAVCGSHCWFQHIQNQNKTLSTKKVHQDLAPLFMYGVWLGLANHGDTGYLGQMVPTGPWQEVFADLWSLLLGRIKQSVLLPPAPWAHTSDLPPAPWAHTSEAAVNVWLCPLARVLQLKGEKRIMISISVCALDNTHPGATWFFSFWMKYVLWSYFKTKVSYTRVPSSYSCWCLNSE